MNATGAGDPETGIKSGNAGYSFSSLGGFLATAQTGNHVDVTFDGSSSGGGTFSVAANNNAGIASAPTSFNVVKDATAPSTACSRSIRTRAATASRHRAALQRCRFRDRVQRLDALGCAGRERRDLPGRRLHRRERGDAAERHRACRRLLRVHAHRHRQRRQCLDVSDDRPRRYDRPERRLDQLPERCLEPQQHRDQLVERHRRRVRNRRHRPRARDRIGQRLDLRRLRLVLSDRRRDEPVRRLRASRPATATRTEIVVTNNAGISTTFSSASVAQLTNASPITRPPAAPAARTSAARRSGSAPRLRTSLHARADRAPAGTA